MTRVVVAGAIIESGRLLLAQRTRPEELRGQWELPGGKVEAGETEADALNRELREELGIGAIVGHRVGSDVDLGADRVLRAYVVTLSAEEADLRLSSAHSAVRWVDGRELREVDLVAADRVWVEDLRSVLDADISGTH